MDNADKQASDATIYLMHHLIKMESKLKLLLIHPSLTPDERKAIQNGLETALNQKATAAGIFNRLRTLDNPPAPMPAAAPPMPTRPGFGPYTGIRGGYCMAFSDGLQGCALQCSDCQQKEREGTPVKNPNA